jgi:RNA polymerase sigma factor (sigma-70 family)
MVELYAPLVLYWCRRGGLDGPLAQDGLDIVQEVFATVATKTIRTFEKDRKPGAFRRHLFTITRNMLRNYKAKKRNQPPGTGGSSAQEILNQVPAPDPSEKEPDPSDPGLDPSEADSPTPQAFLVRRALELLCDKFESQTLKVVLEVVAQGRRIQEVAEQFRMTVGAVRMARYRVLRALRRMLEEEYEEFLT